MADQLGAKLAQLSLAAPVANPQSPMLRPGFGTKGRKFLVRVNAFSIVAPSTVAFHYDVKIGPSDARCPAQLNRRIWRHLADTMNVFQDIAVVYDGRANAYSPTELPAPEGLWEFDLPEEDGAVASRGNHFTVKIQFARRIDLSALALFVGGGRQGSQVDEASVMTALQALNIVIQHTSMQQMPSRGASFFPPPADVASRQISRALELWRGFYTSTRPGIGRLYVNLDVSSGTMYQQGNLADVVVSFARSQDCNFSHANISTNMPPQLGIALDRFLLGVRIKLLAQDATGRYPNRKILAFTNKSAQTTFNTDNGQTTIAAYFQQSYGVRLQHPNWPCVRVSKVALWPMELVEARPGQNPPIRVPALRQGISAISPTNKGSVLSQWGITISTDPLQVEARLLTPPEINYAGNKKIVPRDGVWSVPGQRFINVKKEVKKWLIFVFDRPNFFPQPEAQGLMNGFIQGCGAVGLRVSPATPQMIFYVPRGAAANPNSLAAYMKECSKQAKLGGPPDLLVCLVPKKPSLEYPVIKWVGDVAEGIATQCLSIQNVRKRASAQFWTNIALKVNSKLGGVNSALSAQNLVGIKDPKVPTMIMGTDVIHPAPGSSVPSIAALVGSLNDTATIYTSDVDVQHSRMEVITGLGDMFTNQVGRFRAKFNVLPQRIIMFRDGVSEGQFPIVLGQELAAMRPAARMLNPTYNPAITHIVCGKRHHISIFPVNANDQDRTGNAKAGTIIDTGIVSPFQFDWYLQSHAALLGTSRSAHYTVLADDSVFTADVLQQLVYNLCYTYARCTRSVSYATPAYYADLVCTRAATLLRLADDDSSTINSGAQADRERARLLGVYRSRIRDIHPNHKSALYWM